MKIKGLPKRENLDDTCNYMVIKKYPDGWYFYGTYVDKVQAKNAANNYGGKVISVEKAYKN